MKLVYKVSLALSEQITPDQVKSKIWKSKIHNRYKMSLGRIVLDILHIKDKLIRFFPSLDPSYPL